MNRKEKIKFIKVKFKNAVEIGKHFGFFYAYRDFFSTVIFRTKSSFGKKFNIRMHEHIKKYLINNYGYVINQYQPNQEEEKNLITQNAPIWIFWWQGFDEAPHIVQQCIRSIKKHAGTHPVYLLDKENYANYADIPDYILKKLEKGIITHTHFSDLLRLELLYKNGGIWMDATLFVTENFYEKVHNNFLYSINHRELEDFHVCKGKWSGFFLACGKNNSEVKIFRDILFEYWKYENCLITYFLIDCVIAVCYEKYTQIEMEINNIPVNNTYVFKLQPLLNQTYDHEQYKDICLDTSIFKLSYKFNIDKKNPSNYYNRVINFNNEVI